MDAEGSALTGVPELDISRRLIPREPMSMILILVWRIHFQSAGVEGVGVPGHVED